MATKRAFQRNLRDKDLLKSFVLPAAASTTVISAIIDTDLRTAQGSFPDGVEAVVKTPALSTTIIPNAATATLSIEQSDDLAFGAGLVDILATVVSTGAAGAGVAAAEARAMLGMGTKRYLRAKVAFGAGTTTGAALSAEFALVF